MSKNEESFMRLAISLAKRGAGNTNPNPLVGAVLVKEDKIIGQGYHKKYGGLHAEREALKDCLERGENPKDATLYVTLEPCSHTGKQPPCTQAIIKAGIKKVVIGSRDPNPLVNGEGVNQLKKNGIEVIQDFLKEECDLLNPIFFHYITHKSPYVALKWAMTADGKTATVKGKSKWITNEKSRNYVHYLRERYSCILVGIETVLKDDPTLNVRLSEEEKKTFCIDEIKNPVRIICDSKLRIPLESNVVKTASEIPTIVFHSKSAETFHGKNEFEKKKSLLEKAGLELIASGEEQVCLKEVMKVLYQKGFDSVLIEGGAKINFSALKEGLVNHIYSFVSPKIFGGENGDKIKTPVGGEGFSEVKDSLKLKISSLKNFDDDLLIEYVFLSGEEKCSQE